MADPQLIHDLVRKNDYKEAYEEALLLEKSFGPLEISFFTSRLLANFAALFFLCFGFRSLRFANIVLRIFVRHPTLSYEPAHAILWGVYWQNMRKALKYNLFTMLYSKDSPTHLRAVAFVFYTEAFLGNPLALRSMSKLVRSREVISLGLQKDFMVWLGVVYQMNANAQGCLRAHQQFISLAGQTDPFQVLISKASILNMSISEAGPIEAEIALEECFRVSCSLNNSRNHIQLYGAKTILSALEGNRRAASSFYEKAKAAAQMNNNTLDWVIFSRLSCIYFLVIQNWHEFEVYHGEMRSRLQAYAPVGWYIQESKRLRMVATRVAVGRLFSWPVIQSIGSYLATAHPVFFVRAIGRVASLVFVGNINYWSSAALLEYFTSLRSRAIDTTSSEKFKTILLSIGAMVGEKSDFSLRDSVKELGKYVGSDLVLVENDLTTLIEKASRELGFNPANSLSKTNDESRRYFIDNKGFFVARTVSSELENEPLAFGMLFQVLDVESLEAFDLILNLSTQYLAAVSSIQRNSHLLTQTKILAERAEMAAQVSHDIRSPLTALNMISSLLTEIPEEKRLIVKSATQRINDIANQLLATSKQQLKKIELKKVEQLSTLLDSLVSEKRTQFRDRLGLSIQADLNNSYGAFAEVDAVALKRVLSNLINNSVDAMDKDKGHILLSIQQSPYEMTITVKDDGCGIPRHLIKELGQSRISYGKQDSIESGHGLGLFHARKTLMSFGGKLQIDSTVGLGTSVSLSFQKAAPPKWFVDKILLSEGQSVVCLDDDISIHQIWAGRLNSATPSMAKIRLVNLSSGESLEQWIKENPRRATTALFLIDFELVGQSQTGLDLIEKLNLKRQAILITSRFEEPSIQARCEKLGIKLIPKGLTGNVPIETVRAPRAKINEPQTYATSII